MRAFLYFHPCLLLEYYHRQQHYFSPLSPLCPVPQQECFHRTSLFQSRLQKCHEQGLTVSAAELYAISACTQNKTPLFPGVTTRMECLKHGLSYSASVLRSELSAPTDLLYKKTQTLGGNAISRLLHTCCFAIKDISD